MRRILWTPAGLVDVRRMTSRDRSVDKREWRAATGKGPRAFAGQLKSAFEESRICFVGRDEEEPTSAPFIIYGVTDLPDEPTMGAVWMVATPKIKQFARCLYIDAPERIQWIHERGWYSRGLHNYVDTRNELHLKWLGRIGASLPEGVDKLVNGVLFQYFRLEPNV